jgi:hypothetical protein
MNQILRETAYISRDIAAAEQAGPWPLRHR